MSTKTFPPPDNGSENLFKFLGVSLAIHLAALLLFYAFAPLRDTLLKAMPDKEPIVVDVIDLPPGSGVSSLPKRPSFFTDRNQSVPKETFPDAREAKGLLIVPRSMPRPALPSAPPQNGTKGGGVALSPSGGAPPKSAEREPPGKTLPGEDTVAIKDTEAGKPSDKQAALSGSSAASGEGAGVGAGTGRGASATTHIQPPRPNLFLTDDRIAELAKEYETDAPKGEKGKTLQLNTSELRYQKYLINMKSRIESRWDYPDSAARNGWQGVLRLDFSINKDGTLRDVKLVKSSNYPALDDAAVTALRLASPFPPFPDDFGIEEINIKGSFEYVIYGPPPGRR
ncbi:MAG: energy transducer TonB [Deltaproteobacteria bacterium]|nr:energy transducer TonB [Deltaproteobacteria bacterium]